MASVVLHFTLFNTAVFINFILWLLKLTMLRLSMCHCSSIHKLLKRSELSDCWQMHRYYIYVKYFMNKHTTLSLYHISFIDINIDKMQGKMCMYLLNYKIVIGTLFNMANVFINSIFWLLKLKLMMPSLYSH